MSGTILGQYLLAVLLAVAGITSQVDPVAAQDTNTPQTAQCGFPNKIGILTYQQAQQVEGQLSGHLSQFGIRNAGLGQRVPVRWYFNLPFNASLAEMKGKRAAPVAVTAVMKKIMGISTRCTVTNAFTERSLNDQPVTGDYDVKISYRFREDDAPQDLGSFFKGAPGSIFSKPGIYQLTAIPRGRLSPFFLGPISHTVRVETPTQRPFGITQLKIVNPGSVPGTAFNIGQKSSAETAAKRHCKPYTFRSFVRTGKIISESRDTIQTRDQKEKVYNRAIWKLFKGDQVLEEAGPSATFSFDAKKYGNGQYFLFAELSRQDQGPGPNKFQVNPTRHVIMVFRCKDQDLAGVLPDGDRAKAELDGIAIDLPADEKEQGADGGGIPLKHLNPENAIVVEDVLEPERFVRDVQPPKIIPPDQTSCLACQAEIKRRERIRPRSCGPILSDLNKLILNVVEYDNAERELEQVFVDRILLPLQKIRAPQFNHQKEIVALLKRAAKADVLMSKTGQQILAQGLKNANLRDVRRRQRQGNDAVSAGLLIGADISRGDASQVFIIGDEFKLEQRDAKREKFVKLNTEFNAAAGQAESQASQFASTQLVAANAQIEEMLRGLDAKIENHEKRQAEIREIFLSREMEHCLGSPDNIRSVVAGTEGQFGPGGIPGLNIVLPPHPDRRISKEDFIAAARLTPPKDVEHEGLEDFTPVRFKMDGDAHLRRQEEILDQIEFVDSLQGAAARDDFGRAIVGFLEKGTKLIINQATFNLLFEEDAQVARDAVKNFLPKIPQGFDIVLGTNLAEFIDKDLKVAQKDKLTAGQVAELPAILLGAAVEDVKNVGVGIGNVFASSFDDGPQDEFERAAQHELQRDIAEENARAVNAGLLLLGEFAGAGAFTIGSKILKVGDQVVDSIDDMVTLLNKRRKGDGRNPLSAEEVAKLRNARELAEKTDDMVDSLRVQQQVRKLAEQADNADIAKGINRALDDGDGLSPDVVALLNERAPGLGDDIAKKVDDAINEAPSKQPKVDDVDAGGANQPKPEEANLNRADQPENQPVGQRDPPKDPAENKPAQNKPDDANEPDNGNKANDGEAGGGANRNGDGGDGGDPNPPNNNAGDGDIDPEIAQRLERARERAQRQREAAKKAREESAEKQKAAIEADNAAEKAIDDFNAKRAEVQNQQRQAQQAKKQAEVAKQNVDKVRDERFELLIKDRDRGDFIEAAKKELNPDPIPNPKVPDAKPQRSLQDVVGQENQAKLDQITEFLEARLGERQLSDADLAKLKNEVGLVSDGGNTALVFDNPANPDEVFKIPVFKDGKGGRTFDAELADLNVQGRVDGLKEVQQAGVSNFEIKEVAKITIKKADGTEVEVPALVVKKFPDGTDDFKNLLNDGKLTSDDAIEALRLLHNGAKNGKIFGDLNRGNLARVPIGDDVNKVALAELDSIKDIGDPALARKFALEFQFGGLPPGVEPNAANRLANFKRVANEVLGQENLPFAAKGGEGFFDLLASRANVSIDGRRVDFKKLFANEKAFDDFLEQFDAQKAQKLANEQPEFAGLDDALRKSSDDLDAAAKEADLLQRQAAQQGDELARLNNELKQAGEQANKAVNDAKQPIQNAADARFQAIRQEELVQEAVADLAKEIDRVVDDVLPPPNRVIDDVVDNSPTQQRDGNIRSDAEKDADPDLAFFREDVEAKPLAGNDNIPDVDANDAAKGLDAANDNDLPDFLKDGEANEFDDLANRPDLLDEPSPDAGNIINAAARQEEAAAKLNQLQAKIESGEGVPIRPGNIAAQGTGEVPFDVTQRLASNLENQRFGSGQSTTAFKADPFDVDSDAIKVFEKLPPELADKVVADQIAGAQRLRDAGVNFLDIKDSGKVTFQQRGQTRTNLFLRQQKLPSDAVEIEKLDALAKASGKKALTRDQQIAVLEEYHKLAIKGSAHFDNNLGNIFVQGKGASSRAGLLETGSVENLGSTAEALATAREVAHFRLFGESKTALTSLRDTVAIVEKGGPDAVKVAERLKRSEAAVSGVGGQGVFKDLVDDDLQKAFKDPAKFQAILDDRNARRIAEAANPPSPPSSIVTNLANQTGGASGNPVTTKEVVRNTAITSVAVSIAKSNALDDLADTAKAQRELADGDLSANDNVAPRNKDIAAQAQTLDRDFRQVAREQNLQRAEIRSLQLQISVAKGVGATQDEIQELERRQMVAEAILRDSVDRSDELIDGARNLLRSNEASNSAVIDQAEAITEALGSPARQHKALGIPQTKRRVEAAAQARAVGAGSE